MCIRDRAEAPHIMPIIDPTVAPLQSVSKASLTARLMLSEKSPLPYKTAAVTIHAFEIT